MHQHHNPPNNHGFVHGGVFRAEELAPPQSLVQSSVSEIERQQHELSESLQALRRSLSIVSRTTPPTPEKANTTTAPMHNSPLVLALKAVAARNDDLLRLIATIRDEVSEVAE